jgi:FixJ family two-component response regulator
LVEEVTIEEPVPENIIKLSAAPTVCIVDDDASMANSTRLLVQSFGFKAESFSSAEGFLDSALVHETERLILILDFRMPGLDGLALQRYLLTANKWIPIIFVSARANEGVRARGIAHGAVAFLGKPLSGDQLINALQSAFFWEVHLEERGR